MSPRILSAQIVEAPITTPHPYIMPPEDDQGFDEGYEEAMKEQDNTTEDDDHIRPVRE